MSKTKLLLWAAMWVGIAILFLFWHAYACTFVLLLLACPFAVIAGLKHRRDQRIISEAKHAQFSSPRTPALPMMTNKSTQGRLFVPPPIDRRS